MAEFMMIMKRAGTNDGWDGYIKRLIATGKFRGGSALGNGISVQKGHPDAACVVTGYMRFEAADVDEARSLLDGNPHYEAGGEVELVELVVD